MAITRNTAFDIHNSMTSQFGNLMYGHPYDEELAGPDGMHIHVWVPEGTTQKELSILRGKIRQSQDLVSMSYDWLPDDGRKVVEHAWPACIDSLKRAVREGSLAVLEWPDGSTVSIDLYSASALTKVYEATSEKTKAVIREKIAEGSAGLGQVIGIAFKVISNRGDK